MSQSRIKRLPLNTDHEAPAVEMDLGDFRMICSGESERSALSLRSRVIFHVSRGPEASLPLDILVKHPGEDQVASVDQVCHFLAKLGLVRHILNCYNEGEDLIEIQKSLVRELASQGQEAPFLDYCKSNNIYLVIQAIIENPGRYREPGDVMLCIRRKLGQLCRWRKLSRRKGSSNTPLAIKPKERIINEWPGMIAISSLEDFKTQDPITQEGVIFLYEYGYAFWIATQQQIAPVILHGVLDMIKRDYVQGYQKGFPWPAFEYINSHSEPFLRLCELEQYQTKNELR